MRPRRFAAVAFLSCLQFLHAAAVPETRDVVVYGGTSGGVAAAPIADSPAPDSCPFASIRD